MCLCEYVCCVRGTPYAALPLADPKSAIAFHATRREPHIRTQTHRAEPACECTHRALHITYTHTQTLCPYKRTHHYTARYSRRIRYYLCSLWDLAGTNCAADSLHGCFEWASTRSRSRAQNMFVGVVARLLPVVCRQSDRRMRAWMAVQKCLQTLRLQTKTQRQQERNEARTSAFCLGEK